MQGKRIGWMDGVRSLAMGWILIVHFISIFTTNVHVRFPGVLGPILHGVTGKLAVACFCVLLGYFASKPSRESIVGYALRRYLFFALQILAVELCYYALALLLPDDLYLSVNAPWLYGEPAQLIRDIVADAFLFRAKVLPTYWCVDDFVIGSVVVFAVCRWLNGQKLIWRIVACGSLFAAGVLLGYLWAALCLLGWMLRLLEEVRLPKRLTPVIAVALMALVPWLIHRGETELTYLLDGVACLILLWTFGRFPFLQRLVGWKPLTTLGSYTFELFLLHIPIYNLLETLLQWAQLHRPPDGVYLLYFALALPITVLCAAGWRRLTDRTLNPLLRSLSRRIPG